MPGGGHCAPSSACTRSGEPSTPFAATGAGPNASTGTTVSTLWPSPPRAMRLRTPRSSGVVHQAIKKLPAEQRPCRGARLFRRPDPSRDRHHPGDSRRDRQVPSSLGAGKAPVVAGPEPSGARMTERMPRQGDPLEELHFALEEGDAERPPHRLGQTVLECRTGGPVGRTARRRARRPSPRSRPFGGRWRRRRGLSRRSHRDEWRRPALRGLDVQQLVGHLTGVERDFQTGLTAPEGVHGDADHVTVDRPHGRRSERSDTGRDLRRVARSRRRDPRAHCEMWRVRRRCSATVVPLHGLRMPLGPAPGGTDLRAVDPRGGHPARHRPGPAGARRGQPSAHDRPGGGDAARCDGRRRAPRRRATCARIVLTGAGGGTWQTHLGTSPDAPVAGGPGGRAHRRRCGRLLPARGQPRRPRRAGCRRHR